MEFCHKLLQQSVNQQILLGMGSANERQCYNVMSTLTGWTHTQNDIWSMHDQCISRNCIVSHSWWPQYKFLFLQQYMGNPLLSPRSKTLLCHGTKTNLKASSNRNWTTECLISWNIHATYKDLIRLMRSLYVACMFDTGQSGHDMKFTETLYCLHSSNIWWYSSDSTWEMW